MHIVRWSVISVGRQNCDVVTVDGQFIDHRTKPANNNNIINILCSNLSQSFLSTEACISCFAYRNECFYYIHKWLIYKQRKYIRNECKQTKHDGWARVAIANIVYSNNWLPWRMISTPVTIESCYGTTNMTMMLISFWISVMCTLVHSCVIVVDESTPEK